MHINIYRPQCARSRRAPDPTPVPRESPARHPPSPVRQQPQHRLLFLLLLPPPPPPPPLLHCFVPCLPRRPPASFSPSVNSLATRASIYRIGLIYHSCWDICSFASALQPPPTTSERLIFPAS
uniref:Uncharacterized protein n=1 Tax=Trichogramma kaykai TaxID=54128 RepID=A0ABD2XFD6_9HYME